MSDHIEYIDDYMSGKLSADERKKFEELLKTDAELNEQYLVLSKAKEYIKARTLFEEIENDPDLPAAETQVKKLLGEQPEQAAQEIPPYRYAREGRKIYIWVLSAAAIIGAALIIRSLMAGDPTDRLYKSYYESLSREVLSLTVVRGENDVLLQQGVDCYVEEDYSCALETFSQLSGESYLLGLAYLGVEDYQRALGALLSYSKAHPEHPGANWYLGLTYLKLGKLDSALESLDRIPVMGNIYGKDSQKLNARIEKVKAARAGSD